MRKFSFKRFLIMVIDTGLIYFSFFFASLLINDFHISLEINTVIKSFIWIMPIYLVIFTCFKIYRYIWEYASIEEALQVFLGVLTSFIIISLVTIMLELSLVANFLILSHLILYLLLIGFRYGYRLLIFINEMLSRQNKSIRTLVIGAGNAGCLLIKEIKRNKKIPNMVVCAVDDDIDKVGRFVQGVRVVGTTNELAFIVYKYQINEIILSIPSLNKQAFQNILKKCENLKVKVKVFPPFYQLIDKSFSFSRVREVEINDLLGREEVKIEGNEIEANLCGKNILVTGGGGSIGSELCRQIITYKPKSLIILDQYENNAYEIQNELTKKITENKIDIGMIVLIGSIQDEVRLREIFNTYPIDVIFHAAAHKHVPLMEDNPKEAIKNNVFGTYNLAKMAHEYNIQKFILISSDKAVNPSNIMGATKRLAEMIVMAFNGISFTKFTAVRFGNVLGSNGSVVPLFKKQIKEGGPVTVTSKDVIRYFMTISEAVSLVLQSSCYTAGGEIFVLDMGEPVKIIELAEKMISLSGYEPYKDIKILITGLRPGDKLYEELLTSDEKLEKTEHEKIYCLRQNYINIELIENYLTELKELISTKQVNIAEYIAKMVPTYKSAMEEGSV